MEQSKKFLLNGKLYTASEYFDLFDNQNKIKNVSNNSYFNSSSGGSTYRSNSYNSTSSSGSSIPFDVNKIGASWVKVGSGAYY